jgi:hypothetical protein
MQVTIEYHDNSSLTAEEVVKQAEHNYGKLAKVTVMPESALPYDLIYFGLQQILTHRQLSLLYDKDADYQPSLGDLRKEIQEKCTEILDQVIIDNESKVK